ncbi:copper amine oxidase N-terminal domain-containing protein [Chengkuizengella sp. SCS-71B]|uniref:copper amine oxidase N-terminal domain-containing protein n=1 Tax=Chengkuizengella sp. SCS-71B TaxID=3115290 RepID=UPI0032C22F51
MKRNKVFSFAGVFVLLLGIILTGCQSVGGVDINKALISQLDVSTYEGSGEYSFEFIVDESVELSEDEEKVLEYVNNVKLVIDNIKSEDAFKQSMKGSLQLPVLEDIPFELVLNQHYSELNYTFLIDGIEKPIHLGLDSIEEISNESFDSLSDLEDFQQTSIDLQKLIADFILSNSPNPSTVTVDSVEEEINGEDVDLKKVHIKIDGSELLPLLVETIQNMFEDEEKLKQLITELYDLYMPIMESVMTEEDLLDPSMQLMLNKDLAIEYLYTTLITEVKPFVEELDSMLEEFNNDPILNAIFSEENYLTLDLYVDKDLNIRKEAMELVIQPEMEEFSAIKGFKFYGENEMWNIDGDVEIDEIDTTNAINIMDIENASSPAFLFKEMDKTSSLYQLLSLMELNQMEVLLYPQDDKELAHLYDEPFVENGVTYAPLRYVSNELDASVKWDGDTKQINIVDNITGKELVFAIDNNEVLVDGEAVQLETNVIIIDGKSFVPLRFIVENLDSEIYYDNDIKRITITKEY